MHFVLMSSFFNYVVWLLRAGTVSYAQYILGAQYIVQQVLR